MKKHITYFGLIISCLLFCSCSNLKEVQCTGVKGFKPNKIDLTGIDADIQLGIKNPNTVGFSVYRSTFDVTFNGVYLGKAKSTKRVRVAPNSDKSYSFTLKGNFKNVGLNDVMKLVGGGKGSLEVKGNIKAGKFFIKKRIPVDVKERVGL